MLPVKQDGKKDTKTVIVTGDDEEVIQAVVSGKIVAYSLESKLGDCKRAAYVRRVALERITGKSLDGLPLEGLDYESILGQCCEMPVGYVQILWVSPGCCCWTEKSSRCSWLPPKGVWRPALTAVSKLFTSVVEPPTCILKDGMTRASVVRFTTAKREAGLNFFLEEPLNFETLASVFNRSSLFGRLQTIRCAIAGKNLYIRFICSTDDAMGMNMVSKGVQNVLEYLHADFLDMDVIGISENYCSDKKPAAVNWIEGRGKSVVCEAIIIEEVVKKVLKTDVASLVELNMHKRERERESKW